MKQLAIGLLSIVALSSAAVDCRAAATLDWRPLFKDTPLPKVTASKDPAVIAQGQYLVTAVAHCTACHAPQSATAFATPEATRKLIPSGGREWDFGSMGVLRSLNITQDPVVGIGQWSDAEIARAIKYGVDKDGYPLIYMNGLGTFDDRDLQAIISYLRTVAPVAGKAPRSEFTDSGKAALPTEYPGFLQPKPQSPVTYAPAGDVSVKRGAYLANGPAACVSCHSQVDWSPKQAIRGPAFAGSLEAIPDADNASLEINAPNLTPSKQYGAITGWTEETFIARIRTGRAVKNSPMPWENFRLMTDSDLRSIFHYLKSLQAIDRNAGPIYRPAGWKPDGAK